MAQLLEQRLLPKPRRDRPAAPELLHRLDEDHPRERMAVVGDLAALGDSAAIAVSSIARRLEDRNGHVRRAAARALGELSAAETWGRTPGSLAAAAVPQLVRRLADPDPDVRKAAQKPFQELRGTGAIGDMGVAVAPVVPDLDKQLCDEDWLQREAAARAAGGLGCVAAPLLPRLLAAVADSSHQVRKAAKASLESLCACEDLEDLRCFGAPVALELQEKLKHDEDWRIRCAAAWALGTAGGAVAVGARKLAEVLTSRGEKEDYMLALEALSNLGLAAAPALPEIVRKMFDDEEAVRETAKVVHAKFLMLRGQVPPSQAPELGRLLRKLNHKDPWYRKEAAEELAELGPAAGPALPQLLESVRDDDFDASVAATKALQALREAGMLGNFDGRGAEGGPDLDIGAALLGALNDPEWTVQLHAAEALARLAAAVAPAVLKLAARVERETEVDAQRAAKKLWKALQKERALLELGEVLDAILPVLLDRVAELDGPKALMALGALELLHKSGLLQDPEGHLAEAGEVIREE